MAVGTITLFDLPSKEPNAAWSLNPWKIRLLLNYKGLEYETKWTEYPDIKTVLESHVDPNPTGHPYTIPAITLPDGTWIQDSYKIAKAIEERYPERPLDLESPYQARIQALVPNAIVPIMAIGLNQIPRRLLNKPSYDYWMVDRAPRAGGDFAGNEAKNGGEVAYTASEPALKEITAMLKENADGPFFGGKDVSYADFVWIGALEFLRRIGDDVLEGALSHSGDRTVHENLLEAAKPWLARNTY